MSASLDQPIPGACYKFTVKSAEEAASLIRERLGPAARVLSVRSVEASGLSRLWAAPKLEVIAQLDAPAEEEVASAGLSPGSEAKTAGPASSMAPSQRPGPPTQDLAEAVAKGDDFTQNHRVPSARPAGSPPSPVLRRTAAAPPLADLLRRSGLSELALGRLQQIPAWSELTAAPLHRALVEIGRHLQAESSRRWGGAPLDRAAFLGTPGVGRTTALCKWLGLEVFRRARLGHVITAEFDRPNSSGGLPVYCEALGVPVARYPAATQPAVPGGFVYFDLPGVSLRDGADNSAVADFLDRERITQRVLVLNAAYDHAALRSAYAAGRDLGATHLVFTHLDEVPQWGKLWDYLLDGALEPLFLATGPSLTGDCEEDVFGLLVRRTLAGALPEPAYASPSAEALAKADSDDDEAEDPPARPFNSKRAASDYS